MKTVTTSIRNGLLAAAILNALRESGAFTVRPVDGPGSLPEACRTAGAEITLLEVSGSPGYTMDERLSEARSLRRDVPGCKVLLLCDDNSAPELARRVAQAKRDRAIDEFVFSSVSESYLIDLMDAM